MVPERGRDGNDTSPDGLGSRQSLVEALTSKGASCMTRHQRKRLIDTARREVDMKSQARVEAVPWDEAKRIAPWEETERLGRIVETEPLLDGRRNVLRMFKEFFASAH